MDVITQPSHVHPNVRGRGGRGRGRGRGTGAPVFRNAAWRRPATEQPNQQHEERHEEDDGMQDDHDVEEPYHASPSADMVQNSTLHEDVNDEAFDTEADVPGMDFMQLQSKEEKDAYYQELKKKKNEEFTWAVENGLLDPPGVRKRLEDLITLVGTCEQMCPLIQSVEREIQARLSVWEKIPGTNCVDVRRAVKYYERGTGDRVVPSDVRPPRVLKKTLDYLFHSLMTSNPFFDTHDFISDRARAVRNDFTLQHVNDLRAIHAHYRVVRYHILALHHFQVAGKKFNKDGEGKMIGNCLESLKEFWEDVGTKKAQSVSAPADEERDSVDEEDELEFWLYNRLWHVRNERERPERIPEGVRKHTVFKLVTKFRLQVQKASQPITKSSTLRVDEAAMGTFAELAIALKQLGNGGAGGRVMTYMFACLVEWLFGKGTIEDIEDIRGDLEDWEIIDGVEREGDDEIAHTQAANIIAEDVQEDEVLTEEEDEDETGDAHNEGVQWEEQAARASVQSSLGVGTFGFPLTQPSAAPSNPFANGVSPLGNRPSPFGALPANAFATGTSPFGAKPSPFGAQPNVVTTSAFGPQATNGSPFGQQPTKPTSTAPSTTQVSSAFPSRPSPSVSTPQPVPEPAKSVLNPMAEPFKLPEIPASAATPPPGTKSSFAFITTESSMFGNSSTAPPSQPSIFSTPLTAPQAPPPIQTSFTTSSLSLDIDAGGQTPVTRSPPPMDRKTTISLPSTPSIEKLDNNFLQAPPTPTISGLQDAPPPTLERYPPPFTPTSSTSLKALFKGSLTTTNLGFGTFGELSPLVISPAMSRQNTIQSFGKWSAGPPSPSPVSSSPKPALQPQQPASETKSMAITLSPEDLEARLTAIPPPVLRRSFGKWRTKAEKERHFREEAQKAAEAGEAYHKKVMMMRKSVNGNGLSSSAGANGNGGVRGDEAIFSKSWGPSSIEKKKKRRPRPRAGPSFSTNDDIGKRLEQTRADHAARWRKGSFLEQVKQLVPKAAIPSSSSHLSNSRSMAKSLFATPPSALTLPSSSKTPTVLPWDIWLSLNDEREGTAIWLEGKFTDTEAHVQPEWLKLGTGDDQDRNVLVISSPSPKTVPPAGPGLLVFELTPSQESDDELEKRYVMLDDLVRLRSVLRRLREDAAGGATRYMPAVVLVSWEQSGEALDEAEKMLKAELSLPTSTTASTSAPLPPPAISSYSIFRPSMTAATLDSDFSQSITHLSLDWEGKRGRWSNVKAVWKGFDAILEPFVNEWVTNCSSRDGKGKDRMEFDFGFYSLLMETIVEITRKQEVRLSELVLSSPTSILPELPGFPSKNYEEVDSDDTMYEVAINWLSAMASINGDNESLQSMETYRALGKPFPILPFIEHVRRIPLHRMLSAISTGPALSNGLGKTVSAPPIPSTWIPHHILSYHRKTFEEEVEGARAGLVRAKTMRRRRRRSSASESPERKRRKLQESSWSLSNASLSGSVSTSPALTNGGSDLGDSLLSIPSSPRVNGHADWDTSSRSASPEKDGKVTVAMLRALTKNIRDKYIQLD